jgi:molybdopterin synthase catalytic subunit
MSVLKRQALTLFSLVPHETLSLVRIVYLLRYSVGSDIEFGHVGTKVSRLEYQAYSKLAITTMQDIIHTAFKRSSDGQLLRCAVEHRLGDVPVGSSSIIVAVSSCHRKEAFDACEFILEEIKAKAQIWKREYYAGIPVSEAVWKANHS